MSFKIIPEADGLGYTIKDVPIFETHSNRGFDCNDQWLTEATQNFETMKKIGYRPVVIIGHNQKGVEKESNGFLDNLRVKEAVNYAGEKVKQLYADLVRIPKELKEKIVKNAYPGRSVEILPKSKRILALALLGGTTPHFALPQMVYKNNEESIWCTGLNYHVRSEPMKFDAEQKAELQAMIAAAVGGATNYQREDAPQVYELSAEEAIDWLQQYEAPEMFQGEDGNYYSLGENDVYYAWPNWALKLAQTKGASTAVTSAAKASPVARKVARKVGTMARGAGIQAQRGMLRAKSAASDIAGTMRKHPVAAVAGAGLAGAGLGAGIDRMTSRKQTGYAIDEQTGIVYYAGEVVGQVNPLVDPNPEAIPQFEEGGSPDLQTDPGTDGETPPGGSPDTQTPLIEPIDESAAGFQLETETQLYELQQRLDRTERANALLQAGKRAEQYRLYLSDQKKNGAPIGDVQGVVDYLMSLNDEQVKGYMKNLESSPKVMLGAMNYDINSATGAVNGVTETEIVQDYNLNKQQYQSMGVTLEDLKNAKYVRATKV